MLKIERKVLDIPVILPVGPICLHTNPIKDSLHGFAMAWKNQYASVLHEEAKVQPPCPILLFHQIRQRFKSLDFVYEL